MPPNSKQTTLNYAKKNRRKAVSVLFQIAFLIVLFLIIINAVFITDTYKPLSSECMTNTDGFIALSYFGVDRSGSPKYIAKDVLEKQLTTLKKQGFETISQQQIIDFYDKDTPLPEKALFLSFEDGRTDSSNFSQTILEKLNYKATMFTYANKMNTRDSKFLKPKHLTSMTNSGYWELGSNGYRLTYINIFNAKGEYLGEIEENEVPDKTSIEYYNHYLMDFLRDEYMIPKETRTEMQQRIASDYEKMNEIYTGNFGSMPKVYAIMHANALYNTMHTDVESVNDNLIKKYFSLHFNRDIKAFNRSTDNKYDLNRLQVAPDWPVNHLLMRIQTDSKWPVKFVAGDVDTASKWSIVNGVGEFDLGKIILTTEPGKEVKAILSETLPSFFSASFDLKGNVMGRQTVSIESIDSDQALQIVLEKNKLYVYHQKQGDKPQLLFERLLDEISWSGEDYAFNKATQYDYFDTQAGSRIDENEYPSTLNNDRYIVMTLDNETLQIEIDDLEIAKVKIPFSSTSYQLSLGGSSIPQKTSHEQAIDMIYDSIFEDITIQSHDHVLYAVHESKKESIYRTVSNMFSNIIDFFIEKF